MKLRMLAASLLLLAICPSARAWWSTGHMVVAQIAYDRLDPAVRKEADRLLTIGALPESRSFVTASVWADDLKALDVHLYDEWHYLDIPFSPDGTSLPPVERVGNVQWAIQQCTRILKSAKAPDQEKARALKLLIHFVGDVHQPLHCAARVTAAHSTGDRGGNDYHLVGKYRNLHAYWDAGAGLFEDVKRPLDSAGERAIKYLADRSVTANPTTSFPNLTVTDVHAWVLESSNLAQSAVYNTPEDQTPTDGYRQSTQDTSLRQVALAGYRLANLLNDALKQ